MLPAESENDALTNGCTDGRTDRGTLERNFLNGGYNIIPRTFLKWRGIKHDLYPVLWWWWCVSEGATKALLVGY